MQKQKTDRDCAVCVFAALSGLPYEEIAADLPEAVTTGISADMCQSYFERKGFRVLRYGEEDATYTFPCAHLVGAPIYTHDVCHWVLQPDPNNIFDPSPCNFFFPNDARMLNFSVWGRRILTLTLQRGFTVP